MTIIDGRLEAEKVIQNLREEVSHLAIKPHLAIILIGNNPSSEIYVSSKISKAKEIGIETEILKFDNISEDELLQIIEDLNNRADVTGIIVQLPLPNHISQGKVQAKILPEKDVDAFNPYNVGMLYLGFDPYFISPTPNGIMHLIKTCCPNIEGKNIVIIGKSNIVGKPLASICMKEHATVSICHSLTKDLASITKRADIIIIATGATEFFGKEYFSEGQIVIDVGITRKDNGKLAGDVRFDEVSQIVSHISPVPGGVGPMTVAYLMVNCVLSAKYASK